MTADTRGRGRADERRRRVMADTGRRGREVEEGE